MKKHHVILKQGVFLLAAVLLAAGLQTWAFSEPSATPPSGDAYAPINTGPTTQDKRDASGNAAWITADGLGSRYGAIFASLSGSVGVGTTTPAVKLDVKGEVRPGNTNLTCASAITGALRWNAGYVEACDGTNWKQLSYAALAPSCSPSSVQNGVITAYPDCKITCNNGYTLGDDMASCVPYLSVTSPYPGIGTYYSTYQVSVAGKSSLSIFRVAGNAAGYHTTTVSEGSVVFYDSSNNIVSSTAVASCTGNRVNNDNTTCQISTPSVGTVAVPSRASYVKAKLYTYSANCFEDCQPWNGSGSFSVYFNIN